MHACRAALLVLLAGSGKALTLTELAARMPLDVSVVSRHLKVLRELGAVRAERRGHKVHHSLDCADLVVRLRNLVDAAAVRPGGRLVVSDIVLDAPLPAALAGNLDALIGCVANAALRDDYLAAARAAGFAEVEILRDASYGAALGPDTPFIAQTLPPHFHVTMSGLRDWGDGLGLGAATVRCVWGLPGRLGAKRRSPGEPHTQRTVTSASTRNRLPCAVIQRRA